MPSGTEAVSGETVTQPPEPALHVTPTVMDRFAELTGDRSSLHMDPAFAQRSMYRQRVAHGMLPVACAAMLFPPSGRVSRSITKIAARFLKPVYVGDWLMIEARAVGTSGAEPSTEVEYAIKNRDSGAVVTTVQVVCGVAKSAEKDSRTPQAGRESTAGPLPSSPLMEQEWQFDGIEKGQQAGLEFRVTAESLELFRRFLLEGREGGQSPDDLRGIGAPDVLAASLVSTFAGMCLPGKYATLTDFVITFAEPIRLGVSYKLTGTVEHKSQSTGSVTEGLAIREVGGGRSLVATGKAGVRVNEPPVRGPAVSALRDRDLDLQLKDKVVVVTGGSRGIGATTAKLLALHGARVVVNYLQAGREAEAVVAEIAEAGGRAFAAQADVSDRAQVRRMMAAACERYRTVDVLVNNATADFYPVPFMELTWDRLQRDLDVTLKGAFNCCQEVIPTMMKNGGGKIINLSTVATDDPPPNQSKYVVAKSALVGLTRSLAVELAAHNIQVNMVAASLVETDLVKHLPKIFVKGMQNDTPMKRNATTTDVAKAVVFLASALSSFTTGQRLMVTGGNPPFV